MTLSRNAQLVALTHFASGVNNEVTFSQKRFAGLPTQHNEGLAELVAAGMVIRTENKNIVVFAASPTIGCPFADFEAMKREESWSF